MVKDPVQEEKKQVLSFGRVGFVFFGFIGALSYWRHHETAAYIFSGLAVFFIVMTLIAPPVMRMVYRGWMSVVGVIGRVNQVLLLTLVFILFFVPTSLVLKLFGRNFMKTKYDPAAESYWEPRDETPISPERYEQRF